MKLENVKAVITGAGSGLGEGTEARQDELQVAVRQQF